MKTGYIGLLAAAATTFFSYNMASALTATEDECIHEKIHEKECAKAKAEIKPETKAEQKEYAGSKADSLETKTEAKEKYEEKKTAEKTLTDEIKIGELEKKLEKTLMDSGECEKVNWRYFPVAKKDKLNILDCRIRDKKGEEYSKFIINLDTVCNVYNYKKPLILILRPVDFLFERDVVIHTKDGAVYSLSFEDKVAKKVGDILGAYIEKNVSKEERKKCQEKD